MDPKVEQSPFRTGGEGERERKREAVLRTAVEMFNERGFKATSLDEVAARLGVTKPVIYYYFANKEQVLFQCVRQGVDRLHEAMAQARTLPGDGLDRLRAFLIRYGEVMTDSFGKCVIRTNDDELSPASAKQFRAIKGEIDLALRRLLEEGQADGSLAVGDVRTTAFTMAGALNWVARWFDPDGPQTATEVSEAVVEVLLAGVAPRR